VALPTSFNTDVLASTISHWITSRGFVDNIFSTNALFYKIKERSQRDGMIAGGHNIVIPLEYAKNTTSGSYSGYDLLDISASQPFTAAEFAWKQLFVSVSISGLEQLQNAGSEAQLNILEGRLNNARRSMISTFDSQLYLDGTGNGSKDILGIGLGIDSAGTYGGINRTNETWWSSKEAAAGGVLTTAQMQDMYNQCQIASPKERVDLILTTQVVHEGYEDLLEPDKRFQDSEMASAGFENLKYKGAPVIWDSDATAQIMWFVNTDYFILATHTQRNFVATPPKTPINQDADVMQILWAGNLCQTNCKKSGKVTGITNS
jgi:hypothetical protein